MRSVLFRINNGNKTPDDSDAGVSLEPWCPDQSITKIYHLNGFKALPVLAIFKQSSSRGLERTSRLRMKPSFPEGGNGDVTSDDRRNWDLARETYLLRV